MKIEIPREEAQAMIQDDHENWDTIESSIVDTSRWSNMYEGVFAHLPSNKFYSFSWSEGATECQDESPFEYEDVVEGTEVERKEVMQTVWVTVEAGG